MHRRNRTISLEFQINDEIAIGQRNRPLSYWPSGRFVGCGGTQRSLPTTSTVNDHHPFRLAKVVSVEVRNVVERRSGIIGGMAKYIAKLMGEADGLHGFDDKRHI
jgi:hypothetical protein